jgi:general secretion pathway protein A
MTKPHDENRWLEYLGLRKNPFPVVPDVDDFYVCDPIDQVLTELMHGITARKGFMIFTGEVGLGKTTICRKIMNILDEKGVHSSLVFHTFYQENELLREIVRDFGLQSDSLILSDQMKVLNDFLLDQHRQGKNCVMIIDDAQNLNHKSLELIRMISNLETNREKLVQILLIGQPELEEALNSYNLRQLKSRVMIHAKAKPLSPESLQGYVMFKLYMAGNTGQIKVPKDVINKIYRITQGNLRQVNNYMERCLQAAFVHNTTRISRRVLKCAHQDLTSGRSCWWPSKRFVWGVSTALVLFMMGWLLYPDKWSTLSGFSAPKNYVSVGFSPASEGSYEGVNGGDLTGKDDEGFQSEPPEAYSSENGWEINDTHAIETFLAAYDLSKFTEEFSDALRVDYLERIVSAIFEATGQQMVMLDHMPETIQQQYGVLTLARGSSGKKTHLFFWKPHLRVTEFYPGYRGEEIMQLEELLALQDLYKYRLDGVVGPKLWAAVKRFQENNQLRITGFPDEETIFLLCHQERILGT